GYSHGMIGGEACGVDERMVITKGRIAQAVPKSIERLAAKIAVGAPGHGVVLERRKLVGRLVECNRQAAGGTEVAGERLGKCGAAFLARIPSLDNCRHMLVGPVYGEGAAIHEQQNCGLPGGMHAFQKLLLRGGQINPRTVATAKTLRVDLHFFALNSW